MKKYIILTLSFILAAVGIITLYLSTQSHTTTTQASTDLLTARQNELQPKQLTTDITTSDESTQSVPTKQPESKLETGTSQIAKGSSNTPVVTLPPVKQQPKQTTPKPKVTEPAEPMDSEDVSGTIQLFLESFDEEGFIYSNPETGNGQYFYYDQVVDYHIDNINIGSEISVTYDEDGDVVKVNGKKVSN